MITTIDTTALYTRLAGVYEGLREQCRGCRGKGYIATSVCSWCGKARTAYDGTNAGLGWVIPASEAEQDARLRELCAVCHSERGGAGYNGYVILSDNHFGSDIYGYYQPTYHAFLVLAVARASGIEVRI